MSRPEPSNAGTGRCPFTGSELTSHVCHTQIEEKEAKFKLAGETESLNQKSEKGGGWRHGSEKCFLFSQD